MHEVSTAEIAAVFECNAVLVGGTPEPRMLSGAPASMRLTPGDLAVAALVLDSGERAGRGVDRAVPTEWQFHPVRSGERRSSPRWGWRATTAPRPSARTSCSCSTICSIRWRWPWSAAGSKARRASSPASASATGSARPCSRRSARTSGPGSKAIGDAVRELRRGGDGRQGARLACRLGNRQDRALPHQPAGPGFGVGRAPDRGRRRHDRPLPAHGAPGREGDPPDAQGICRARRACEASRAGADPRPSAADRLGAGAGRADRLSPRRRPRAAAEARTRSRPNPELIVNEPAVGYRLRMTRS